MKVDIRELIKKLKYNFIISDPFPEHTKYLRRKIKFPYKKPEDISIWEAFYLGQQDLIKKLEVLENHQCSCDNPIWTTECFEMYVKCLNCCNGDY